MDIKSEVSRRRTFAIISHPDAGKTTLTEKLLLFGGAIQEAGTVKAKKSKKFATSDWMAIEKERGISVASSVMQFEYKNCILNLLDTPGHRDFSEDTYRVLTAVDCALMIIDSSKGVEPQTIKLLEVCRSRKTPIVTFINKLDREGKSPLELIDEIESILKIKCVPITWPIGMGKSFSGVYDIEKNKTFTFTNSLQETDKNQQIFEEINIGNKKIDSMYIDSANEEVELLSLEERSFDKENFITGEKTPVYFGSAMNNFGVIHVLDKLVADAPQPLPRRSIERIVNTDEKKFSSFVFKIQANMDPQHRDRIAFLRVCSGRFKRGMKLNHVKTNKEIRASQVVSFLSKRREVIEDAFAGDIIGLINHGNIEIGDSFTEGEKLTFTGIPFFAPELFQSIQLRDPLKSKQLNKGLQQLGEEGAIQVFKPYLGNEIILGAVGQLQFEVVLHRLKAEYSVEAQNRSVSRYGARWIKSDDLKELDEFKKKNSASIYTDASGSLAFIATSKPNLDLTQERWPKVKFLKMREQIQTI